MLWQAGEGMRPMGSELRCHTPPKPEAPGALPQNGPNELFREACQCLPPAALPGQPRPTEELTASPATPLRHPIRHDTHTTLYDTLRHFTTLHTTRHFTTLYDTLRHFTTLHTTHIREPKAQSRAVNCDRTPLCLHQRCQAGCI